MGKDDAILTERKIGIIMPPPEIKKIIDKAAELVGKYGSNIEGLMKNEEKNLPKFSFLKPGDPYRPYYDYKVSHVAKNIINKTTIPADSGIIYSSNRDAKIFLGKKTESSTDALTNLSKISKGKNLQDEIRKYIEERKLDKEAEIKAPQPDIYSISHPNIPPLEMDLIKLTAQFVARNGQRFLSGLSEREAKNSQFDFLKPQHNLFGYFTYLVDSYTKCLIPKKEEQLKLNQMANDRNFILRRSTDRYLWEKKSKENQKKKDKVDELERAQMAQIDWYDFIVVEVIDFTEEELNNTVPITSNNQYANVNVSSFSGNVNLLLTNGNPNNSTNIPNNINNITVLGQNNNIFKSENNFQDDILISNESADGFGNKKLLGLAAFEKNKDSQTQFSKENKNIDENLLNIIQENPEIIKNIDKKILINNEENKKLNINPADKNIPEPGMKIISNYKRKTETTVKKTDLQKCPLCKENIPIDDLSQHMKIELLDPKWKEINKELTERKMEVSLAPTSDFIGYLGEFAKDRPDLFGDDVNDIMKIEDRKKLETKYNMQNIKWDGFAPNMSRTTANIAMLAQQTKKNYEESRKQDKNEVINTQNVTKENVNTSEGNKQNVGGISNVGNPVAISVTQQAPILKNQVPVSVQNTAGKFNMSIEGEGLQNKKNLENLVSEELWVKKYPVIYFIFN